MVEVLSFKKDYLFGYKTGFTVSGMARNSYHVQVRVLTSFPTENTVTKLLNISR